MKKKPLVSLHQQKHPSVHFISSFMTFYKLSPVRYILHMDRKKIDALFNLCMVRTLRFNFLMQTLSEETKSSDVNALINELDLEIFKKDSRIKQEDRAECKGVSKVSTREKRRFVAQNSSHTHLTTSIISVKHSWRIIIGRNS